jgi:hypothetical protein
VFTQLIDGVADGKYHLLLGAGASHGCGNKSGPLPLGRELERVLLSAIGENPDDQLGLPLAYESALAVLGESDTVALLRARYGGCDSLPWHTLLPRFGWEAIWTFNIDDVVEHAYRTASRPVQRGHVYLWQDQPAPTGGKVDHVPIVHLHGYVGEHDRRSDPQLIFGWSEYLGALSASARTNWHSRFRGTYSTFPAIVIGARLTEELDFAEILRFGNSAATYGTPSIIVAPRISDSHKALYRRWGLEPVESTAAEFFEYLDQGVRTRSLEAGPAYSTRYTARSFVSLEPENATASPGHDFYGGHEPEWSDILAELDAQSQWVSDLVEGIGSAADPSMFQRLFLLHGAPFSGKSTALLRLARQLQRRGWQPVYLAGREILDPNETLQYFAARPNAFLVIDSVHYDITELEAILERARARQQRFVVIGADRSRDVVRRARMMQTNFVVGIDERIFVEPSDQMWTRIVQKRSERARLGRLERLGDMAVKKYFVDHKRELFSALAAVEDAGGFIDRGLRVVVGLPDDARTAFCTVALIGYFDMPTPASVAASTSGMRVSALLDACSGPGVLSDWIALSTRETGLLNLRHRYLGDLLVDNHRKLPVGASLGHLATEVCVAVADRVNIHAIRDKRIEYRIVAALMDYDFVKRVVSRADVDSWYAQLEPHYAWNARYWEQRALALENALDRAFSYANRAVQLHRGAFTLNTLGVVLMRRSRSAAGQSPRGPWFKYWQEAETALAESLVDGAGRFDHPYMTFFGHTKRIHALVGDDPEWIELAPAVYRRWRADAQAAGVLADKAARDLVDALPGSWRLTSKS